MGLDSGNMDYGHRVVSICGALVVERTISRPQTHEENAIEKI